MLKDFMKDDPPRRLVESVSFEGARLYKIVHGVLHGQEGGFDAAEAERARGLATRRRPSADKEGTPASMAAAAAFGTYWLFAEVCGVRTFSHSLGHPLAHQMGTCRMGSDPSSSVVNADGESWDVRNLYVADASVFPTPSGANPMVTTLAMAHCIAHRLKRKLAGNKPAMPKAAL